MIHKSILERRYCAATFFLVALAATFGCQKSSTSPADNALETPKSPREVLRQMADVYRGAQSYEDAGELHIVAENGAEDEPKPFAVALARPNKVRVHSLGAMVVADGSKFRAATPSMAEQVFVRPCEAGLSLEDFRADELLVQAMRGQLDAFLPQLTLLLDSNAVATLTADGTIEQLPNADFQGETCYRVAVTDRRGTAVYWISPASYLLRKLEFPMNAIRQKFPLSSVWADFRGARANGAISPLAFQMEIPSSARLVKQFILPGPEAPPPFLAQPAGEFKFLDFRGEKVDRESLAGKVVVLDMWATWCGWCFEGLPLLEQVYEKYKDDDRVVILAVCKDETAVSDETVREAFAKQKLTIPIVRDLEQSSDKTFQIQALPTSVILGADGSVQDYHVGFDAQLATTLPQKIERLLAGENLAQQELEAYQQERVEYEKRLAEVLVEAAQNDAEEVARTPSTSK